MTSHAKFHVNPSKGASRQKGEIYAKIFVAINLFSETHLQVRPFADFCVQWLKRRGLAQGCAFWGLKNLKLIFNVFIRKNLKKLQWRLWGKLSNSLNGHNFGCV